jgi:hypothetical protein
MNSNFAFGRNPALASASLAIPVYWQSVSSLPPATGPKPYKHHLSLSPSSFSASPMA